MEIQSTKLGDPLIATKQKGQASFKKSPNLSLEFFCPVRLRESSRECKIGKGAIFY
jgi:hypothetical protein